jgi:uncharacterized protein YycO
MFSKELLQPGDSIMYKPSNLIGVIIALKTWSWTSHVETYIGNDQSIGARSDGVKVWPLRNDKYVKAILRPRGNFDIVAALEWFLNYADGDKYDWQGLFSFYIPKQKDVDDPTANYRKEFCSQLCTMFYRKGKFNPFAEKYPDKLISPAQFFQTPMFDIIWEA